MDMRHDPPRKPIPVHIDPATLTRHIEWIGGKCDLRTAAEIDTERFLDAVLGEAVRETQRCALIRKYQRQDGNIWTRSC